MGSILAPTVHPHTRGDDEKLACPVCGKGLEVRLAQGRRSGKSFLMLACPEDGRHFRGFVNDADYVRQVLARIQMEDEVKRIAEERTRTEERLRRLGRAYVDGLYSDDDYKRQKRELEDRLAGLVVPEADAAKAVGEMLQDLPRLWSAATPSERRRLLLTMLDAVYVDARKEHRVVAIRATPPFRPLLEIATTRPDSDVELYVMEKEAPAAWGEQQALSGPCFWWRRGRLELYRKRETLALAA